MKTPAPCVRSGAKSGGAFGAILALGAVVALGACKPAASARALCGADELVVHGVCARPAEAASFCGKAARWEDGACTPSGCGEDLVRDEVTAECLGTRALRVLAAGAHAVIDEGQTVGCREGSSLRVAAGHLRCVAREDGPPRDRCGAGAAFDASARACVALVDERGMVDAARWTRALLGTDGGAGSPELCARVTVDPAAYGLAGGADAIVDLAVDIVFPDNDVTLVRADVRADLRANAPPAPMSPASSPHAIPPAAEALVQRAVAAPIALLRVMGGTSSAASVSTRVRCAIRGASPPIGVSGDVAARSGS